ncbi:class I SAM-dependent DNA methyltransferase [Oceanobacillus bengalensis]|uniref:Class I SAM-dependent methyltransferase n=1 Tax=Oceanobacillus bengalensis TaxID=1435466 RepID=A0A494Z5U1_9BACI|nr:class I SAM-dependent methyltransferase [Oceanobacillus bengalensis]RKQ17873.1 class I SAM-dependent methyltransferase [Oceanobacillus bengalensis]
MAYQQMANLYDKLMSEAPYDEWANFTIEKLKNRDINKMVDLGCGTGEITTRLSAAGYQLIGVDNSTDMLAYAEHKANERNLSIQWLHQDLRELEGLSDIDVAVSYCDVINYITEEEELQNVFQRTFDLLKNGGIFLFDVHSLHQVENHYKNNTFADVLDDAAYIWYCSQGDVPGEMYHDLTFFSLDDGKYIRFDEYHHQRTYSIQFYEKILYEAGFENVKIYADFSLNQENIHENAERIFFSAEKRLG